MPIVIVIPEDIERELRAANPRLDADARDSFVVGQYRAGSISTGDVALILGFSTRFQAGPWLGERGVERNYTEHDLNDDRTTLAKLAKARDHDSKGP